VLLSALRFREWNLHRQNPIVMRAGPDHQAHSALRPVSAAEAIKRRGAIKAVGLE